MYDNLWLKRVWIPFWVIQILIAGTWLVLSCIGIGVAVDWEHVDDEVGADWDYVDDEAWAIVIAASAVYLVISLITLIFVIVEIVHLARRRLNPVLPVVFNSLLTTGWMVLFILSVVSVFNGSGFIAWIFNGILFLSSLGKLIYAGVILGRFRKGHVGARGTYAPASRTEPMFETSTAYNGAAPPQVPNPFRDPSRDPSPAAASGHGEMGGGPRYYDSSLTLSPPPPAGHQQV